MLKDDRVLFISGVSSGIGEECFEYFAKLGYVVVGTSRKASKKKGGPCKGCVVRMDLLDDASIRKAVDHTIESYTKIDILINNAGMHLGGALEDTSIEEAKLQLETNFWGTVKLIKAVLPVMRKQGSGHIINISSLGGVMGLPFQSFYSGSKFAVEGITEALSMEVKPFGIKVTLVEPGDFRTGVVQNRIIAKKARENSPYEARFERALKIIEKGENLGEKPIKIAALIERIIQMRNPKLRYRIGKKHELLAAGLHTFLPDRVFEKIIMDNYGM